MQGMVTQHVTLSFPTRVKFGKQMSFYYLQNDWQCALFKSVDTKFRILSIACLLLSSAEDDSTTDVSGIPTEPVCDSDNSDDVMHNDSSSEDSEVASDSDEREIVIKNPVNKAVKGANNPEAAAHLNKSQTKKTQRQLEKKRAKRKAYIASKKRKIEAAKGWFFHEATFNCGLTLLMVVQTCKITKNIICGGNVIKNHAYTYCRNCRN